jgi:hypothetical protein
MVSPRVSRGLLLEVLLCEVLLPALTRFMSTPSRPIHLWKDLGEKVTAVILPGRMVYYNLS